jgi:hypothetical protein
LSDTYIKIFFAAVLIAAIFSTVFILDERDQQRARASLLKVQEELRNLSNNTGYTSPRKIITSAKSGKERYKARRAKPPQPQTTRPHRRLFQATQWAIGLAAAIVGLLASLDALWGPVWPTTPLFSPGYPSFGSPFSIPFSVTNRSEIFTIHNIDIHCGIKRITTSTNGDFSDFSAKLSTINNSILFGSTNTYICPFDIMFKSPPGSKIIYAKSTIWGTYSSPWPWPFDTPIKFDGGFFTLNTLTSPAQWMVGEDPIGLKEPPLPGGRHHPDAKQN